MTDQELLESYRELVQNLARNEDFGDGVAAAFDDMRRLGGSAIMCDLEEDRPLTPFQLADMFSRAIIEGCDPESIPSSWAMLWFPLDCGGQVPDFCASEASESLLRGFFRVLGVSDDIVEKAWQWYIDQPQQRYATTSYEELERRALDFVVQNSGNQSPQDFADQLSQALAADMDPREVTSEWMTALFGGGGFGQPDGKVDSTFIGIVLRLCGVDERDAAHLWEWYRHLRHSSPRPQPDHPRRLRLKRDV